MPEIRLKTAGIDTVISELVATSVPEHVWMNAEIESGYIGQAGDQGTEAASREGCAAWTENGARRDERQTLLFTFRR